MDVSKDSELDSCGKGKQPDEQGEGEEVSEVQRDDALGDAGKLEQKKKEDDDEEMTHEPSGIGILELRDDELTAEPLWRFEDRSTASDEEAIKGFLLETLRQACAEFLRKHEYKGMAYFLHPASETQRVLSSVNVAQGFRGRAAHQQCAEYLRTFASEKKATAMVVVVEDNQLRLPRVRSQVEKSVRAVSIAGADSSSLVLHRGLLIQLESDQQRRVWHVIYQQAAAAANADAHKTTDTPDAKTTDKAEGEKEADRKEKETDAAADTAADADKSTPNLQLSKSMCLRELDVHKCCIMAPIITS